MVFNIFPPMGMPKPWWQNILTAPCKNACFVFFSAANTLRFDYQLQSLVQGYNATRHRSIGMAPEDVTWDNEEAVWKRL